MSTEHDPLCPWVGQCISIVCPTCDAVEAARVEGREQALAEAVRAIVARRERLLPGILVAFGDVFRNGWYRGSSNAERAVEDLREGKDQ